MINSPSKTPARSRASSGASWRRGRDVVASFGGPLVVTVAGVLLLIGGWLLFGGGGSDPSPQASSAPEGTSAAVATGAPADAGAGGGGSSPGGGHASAGTAGHLEDDAVDPADPITPRATLPPGTWNGSDAVPMPAPSVSATTPSVASPTVPVGSQVDAPDGWRPVVEGFGKDWANPYGGKSAWLARVVRWCGPQLAAGFADTDITAVPTDTLTGVQELVGGGEVTDARLTYASGTTVRVRAVIGAQGWKVVTVEPDTR